LQADYDLPPHSSPTGFAQESLSLLNVGLPEDHQRNPLIIASRSSVGEENIQLVSYLPSSSNDYTTIITPAQDFPSQIHKIRLYSRLK